jgi:hypothetical protein
LHLLLAVDRDQVLAAKAEHSIIDLIPSFWFTFK